MEVKRWVTVKNDYPIHSSNGELAMTIRPGEIGWIMNVHEDGTIYVCFAQTHRCFKVTDLAPIPLPTYEEAVGVMKDASGHHCTRSLAYQFNIKFHHFPEQALFDKHGEDRIWTEYNRILEEHLAGFMGEDDSEGLMQIIPWINTWHTAGRSGGWLIIELTGSEYDIQHIQDQYEDAKSVIMGKEAFPDPSHEKEWKKQLDASLEQAQFMAISIRFVREAIEDSKKSLADWIKCDHAWSVYDTDEEEIPVDEDSEIEESPDGGDDLDVQVGRARDTVTA